MYVSEEPTAPKESEEAKDSNYLYYTKYWCTTHERFVGFVVGQNRKNIKRVVSNFKRNSHGVKCRIDLYDGKFKIVLKIRKGLYDVQLAEDYINISYFDWLQSHFENVIRELKKLDTQAFRLVVEGRWKSNDGEDEELPEARPDASDIPRQDLDYLQEQDSDRYDRFCERNQRNRDRRNYIRDERDYERDQRREHRRDHRRDHGRNDRRDRRRDSRRYSRRDDRRR